VICGRLSHRPKGPVDKTDSSPGRTHSATPLLERERGVIPVLHTPYDYDKGIS